MELFICLSILTILGFIIAMKSYDYELLGAIMCFIFGIYLCLHILFCLVATYDYNKFIVKRQAFVETLYYARKNKNQFELASITKEVSEWNQQLASAKYDNNVFLLKDYTDDRIMLLKPIR